MAMSNEPQPQRNVIRIMCPKLSCQRILAVPAEARGKLVRCRSCGTTIRIPIKETPKPTPQPQQREAEASDENEAV